MADVLGCEEDVADPLRQAQKLVYDAFDTYDVEQRVQLATQALSICPDCADAYVLLAEHAPRAEDALKYYEQGVAAGERALGKEGIAKYEGVFWSGFETRPYMRARMGLATALWETGRREEAAGHYHELLRLNPNDNQGVRYVLAITLLDLNRDEELQHLLDAYPDDGMADWPYNRALLLFRREGDSQRARDQLGEATRRNAHVPAYLLGDRQLPAQQPDYLEPGKESEAVVYAGAAIGVWHATAGALSWLRQTAQVRLPGHGPSPAALRKQETAELVSLPQSAGVWLADVARLPEVARQPGPKKPPWAVIVIDLERQDMRMIEPSDRKPSAAKLQERLVDAMLEPFQGEPCRPQRVEFRAEQYLRRCQPLLKRIDVSADLCGEEAFGGFDFVLEHLAEGIARWDQGDAPADRSRLAEVPQQRDDVWQVDLRQLGTWIMGDVQPQRPWLTFILSRTHDLILGQEMGMERPAIEAFLDRLAQTVCTPQAGQPHRPGEIQFADAELRQAAEAYLAGLDIRCVLRDELDQLEHAIASLEDHLGHKDQPPLTGVQGVTVDQVGQLFHAADHYYRQAPWRVAPADTMIVIESPQFEPKTWYACVIGQSGTTLGIALYDDLSYVQAMLAGEYFDEEHLRQMRALTVHFEEPFRLSARDVQAAERFGWPVASPEAWPLAVRVEPGPTIRPPVPWELELLEACLRSVPRFLAAKSPSVNVTVPAGSEQTELRLSWMQ